MKFFQKKFLNIFVYIIFLSILISCDKKDILIGFSGELTGINSDLGVHGRNGVSLAIEEINSLGGINGKKVKLLISDDKGKPQRAVEVDREHIKAGVAAIIGHMTSSQSVAVIPLMEKEKMVLFSPTTSTPILSGKKDYFFRVQRSLDYNAKILGKFASEMDSLNNILILMDIDNGAFTNPFRTAFINGFIKADNQLTTTIKFSSLKGVDWNKKIEGIDTDKFDGVFVIASPISTALIIQAIREKDKELIILASSWAATQYLIRHGGRAVDGIFITKTAVVDKQHKEYMEYVDRYTKRFGIAPSFAADHGYHCAKILGLALKETNGKKEGLKDILSNFRNYEYFHEKLALDEYGDAYTKAFIMTIKDGEFKMLHEYMSH